MKTGTRRSVSLVSRTFHLYLFRCILATPNSRCRGHHTDHQTVAPESCDLVPYDPSTVFSYPISKKLVQAIIFGGWGQYPFGGYVSKFEIKCVTRIKISTGDADLGGGVRVSEISVIRNIRYPKYPYTDNQAILGH